MPHASEYEKDDKAALERALLALHVCPHCRQDLQPVAFLEDVWGCQGTHWPKHGTETWHIPSETH